MGVITKIVEFETLEVGNVFKLEGDDVYMKLEESPVNGKKYNTVNLNNGNFVYSSPKLGVILFKVLKEKKDEN